MSTTFWHITQAGPGSVRSSIACIFKCLSVASSVFWHVATAIDKICGPICDFVIRFVAGTRLKDTRDDREKKANLSQEILLQQYA